MFDIAKVETYKIDVALAVLNAFKVYAATHRTEVESFSVETYSNCREQGFAIKVFERGEKFRFKTASFSESRNSDNIVVFVGYDFDDHNVPTDEAYKNGKAFEPGDYGKAAKYIFTELGRKE